LPKNALGVALLLKRYFRFIRIKTAVATQRAPLYFYHADKGYYFEDDEQLKDFIYIVCPSLTEKQASDVLYKIAHGSPLREMQTDYTALGNMLYNSKLNTFEPFTPKVIVTRKINTNYNDKATQPNINNWIPENWLLELFDNDLELVKLSIQMIKACITGESLKKLFWLYGEGGTGKGTLQQLIINLIGIENVATLKITDLNKSRFTTSILIGKSVVIGDDVQKDVLIKDTSDLFSLTTGDIMTIEEKGKKPYSLQLLMTVIQSSNGFPRMDGDESAINRRFRILPFSQKFKGKPNSAIKDDYINRKNVLEYILKLAIETPTEDINPKKSQDLLNSYQEEINPVIGFTRSLFTSELASEFLPNSFVYFLWKGYLVYYEYSSVKKENALHREIKKHLPPNFKAGQRVIPAGREQHIGFYPKEDIPFYANLTYSNGRQSPERRKNAKNERGYWKTE
jgi:putative DNA primase/helicase